MSGLAETAAKKILQGRAAQYQPADPYYEYTTNERGKTKKHKRALPTGLTKQEEKTLRKVRRRAHYLDKGMNLCGFRVGWTFWIGIIPGLGDVVDATLNYTLVVVPSRKLGIPQSLLSKMLVNNAISAGLGFVPLAGDIALAAWKANSRNAHLLEAYLAQLISERGPGGAHADPAAAGPSARHAGHIGNGYGATQSTAVTR